MNRIFRQMFKRTYFKRPPAVCHHQTCKATTNAKRINKARIVTPSNPGIDNRLDILKLESPDFKNLESEDLALDDLEADFMDADKMHVEYEREKKAAADALAYEITKRKHFKPPSLPNFLMWTEKEQIRYLQQLDPNEWTPENLSTKFPASVEIIKKVIKANWKPRYKSDIERHDRSVQRNWVALLQGKFQLGENYKRHLLSFSTRQANFPKEVTTDSKQIIIHNNPKGSTEFSSIINTGSYGNSDQKGKHVQVSMHNPSPAHLNKRSCDPQSDSYVMPGKSLGKELLPLREYKEKVVSLMDEEGVSDELSKRYYDHLKEGIAKHNDEKLDIRESLQVEERSPMHPKKFQKYKKEKLENLLPGQVDVFVEAEQYKMKIEIPKEKFDPSAVYKVKDCIYDADGEFLYRVPGMG